MTWADVGLGIGPLCDRDCPFLSVRNSLIWHRSGTPTQALKPGPFPPGISKCSCEQRDPDTGAWWLQKDADRRNAIRILLVDKKELQ